jgi:hypothetical protein
VKKHHTKRREKMSNKQNVIQRRHTKRREKRETKRHEKNVTHKCHQRQKSNEMHLSVMKRRFVIKRDKK